MDQGAVGFCAMNRKHFLALVTAFATFTLLIAAVLRLWQISTYPPGPHYDEAANLLIARSVAFGGARFFPMVEAYQGREILYYYLSVPLLTFVSDSMFSLRVLSAFCNLITIAASIALGRAMFRGSRGVIVGLVVGVLMTLSFPQIWLARQAYRAVTLPMMQALALLFLFRGLARARRSPSLRERGLGGEVTWAHRRAPLQLAVAGVLAGGAVYTYNASRLFPLWLLIGGIALLLFDRAHWRRRIKQGAIFFGALAITAAPMVIYAFQRPDVFFGRLAEVTQADQSVTLTQSIILHLEMFFIAGDPYFRYNVAGRPYFTLPEGVLLLVGMVLAAYRLTRRIRPLERVAYLLALLSPLMVIPSVISVGGLPPSHMRSLGMVPLIFVLVAVGAEGVIGWIHLRYAVPLRTTLWVGVLVIGGALVGKLYFDWASSAALFYETDADLAAAARWLGDQQLDPNTLVYVAARDKGHPTVMIAPVPPVTWIGTDSLFHPPAGETGLVIFPHSAPPPPDWAAWLAEMALSGLPLAPDGKPAFQAFRLSGDLPLPLAETTLSIHDQYLRYAGMNAPVVTAGDAGEVVMAWQIDAPPPFSDLTPLIQLEDGHGNILYHGDAYMAGTDEWRVGETLLQRISVRVPPATPPGDYGLSVAWVERSTDSYQPYFNQQGGVGAAWAKIGMLRVTRPNAFPDPASLSIDVGTALEVAPDVTLLGWDAPPASVRPGETLPMTFYWQAGEHPASFTARALLVSAEETTELWSGTPIDDRYPPDQWAAGEVLADRVDWQIPRDQAAGSYMLALVVADRQIAIATVEIAGIARAFEAPAVEHILNARFGDQLVLYGYNVSESEGKINLELIWKAQDNIIVDYKVFVHLVNREGIVLTQHDAMPRTDSYPTSLWSAGEYISDPYELSALSGGYALHIGLYSPEDGMRLPLLDDHGQVVGDYVEILD